VNAVTGVNGVNIRNAHSKPATGGSEAGHDVMAHGVERADPNNGDSLPVSQIEELIGNLIADGLHIPSIGVHEDFFSAGVDSLLAVRVVSRIRRALSLELPLRALFENPTVSELARALAGMRRRNPGARAPAAAPQGFRMTITGSVR
jgi:acyl carrier protein